MIFETGVIVSLLAIVLGVAVAIEWGGECSRRGYSVCRHWYARHRTLRREAALRRWCRRPFYPRARKPFVDQFSVPRQMRDFKGGHR